MKEKVTAILCHSLVGHRSDLVYCGKGNEDGGEVDEKVVNFLALEFSGAARV